MEGRARNNSCSRCWCISGQRELSWKICEAAEARDERRLQRKVSASSQEPRSGRERKCWPWSRLAQATTRRSACETTSSRPWSLLVAGSAVGASVAHCGSERLSDESLTLESPDLEAAGCSTLLGQAACKLSCTSVSVRAFTAVISGRIPARKLRPPASTEPESCAPTPAGFCATTVNSFTTSRRNAYADAWPSLSDEASSSRRI
mmetsp:Transcript_7127/g.21822  ORF Transcript_7127/g.21822 Transcript_7127/m.21822 type:complete len:205 (-) Transcript_7127:3605-4219(-)